MPFEFNITTSFRMALKVKLHHHYVMINVVKQELNFELSFQILSIDELFAEFGSSFNHLYQKTTISCEPVKDVHLIV